MQHSLERTEDGCNGRLNSTWWKERNNLKNITEAFETGDRNGNAEYLSNFLLETVQLL